MFDGVTLLFVVACYVARCLSFHIYPQYLCNPIYYSIKIFVFVHKLFYYNKHVTEYINYSFT